MLTVGRISLESLIYIFTENGCFASLGRACLCFTRADSASPILLRVAAGWPGTGAHASTKPRYDPGPRGLQMFGENTR